jgi:hypothetical protein
MVLKVSFFSPNCATVAKFLQWYWRIGAVLLAAPKIARNKVSRIFIYICSILLAAQCTGAL